LRPDDVGAFFFTYLKPFTERYTRKKFHNLYSNWYCMLTKKKVLESIQTLPERFEAETAIEQIVLLEKIRIGLEQSENGKIFSKEETKKRLKKWLK